MPLLPNRLIWREVFTLIGCGWLGFCLVVATTFLVLEHYDPKPEGGNLFIGLLGVTALWVFALLVIFIGMWFRRRVRFSFAIDHQRASSLYVKSKTERVMAATVGVLAAFDGDGPLAAYAGGEAAQGKVRREVWWQKLRKVEFHPDLLAISLHRWPWPVYPLVLYLPHREGYDKVKARIPQLCPQLNL